MSECCGKRGKCDEHAVEVLFAEALEQERKQHAADDGERIVQRHAGGSQATVDFAPQENEQGRPRPTGQSGGNDEGRFGCGPDDGCGIRSGGKAEQKRNGRVDPPLSRQGREARGEKRDGYRARREHDVVGEVAGCRVHRHGADGVRIGKRHPCAPQGESEKRQRHICYGDERARRLCGCIVGHGASPSPSRFPGGCRRAAEDCRPPARSGIRAPL